VKFVGAFNTFGLEVDPGMASTAASDLAWSGGG
jgi:hypothetical protein